MSETDIQRESRNLKHEVTGAQQNTDVDQKDQLLRKSSKTPIVALDRETSEQIEVTVSDVNYIKKMKQEQLEGQLIKKQVEEEIERGKMRELEKAKKVAKTR